MSEHDPIRDQILSDPRAILDDRDLMRALIAADADMQDDKIIDLRSIALERLEKRLDRLEDTHRNVIAAAYDNLHGTNQIHRAVLDVLTPTNFDDFLQFLETELPSILGVDALRLCLESPAASREDLSVTSGVAFFAPGDLDLYFNATPTLRKPVVLRPTQTVAPRIYGHIAGEICSEALLRLDLGEGNLPGMLALGSRDIAVFEASKGTDLLTFFGAVFERTMRRWLG